MKSFLFSILFVVTFIAFPATSFSASNEHLGQKIEEEVEDNRTIMEITAGYSKSEQCEFKASEYTIGFRGYYLGIPFAMKHIDRKEGMRLMQAGVEPPTDGFYVLGWDTLSKEEQKWLEGMLKEGYENAMLFKKEYPHIEPDYNVVFTIKYNLCMEKEEI